jgi:hypothetical protein
MVELPEPSDRAVRAAVAGALRVDGIPDRVWKHLVKLKLIEDYILVPQQETFDVLVARARRLMRKEPGRPKGVRSGTTPTVPLSHAEYFRGLVFSRHVARLAERRDEVQSLRKRLFDGAVLSREQALAWLKQIPPRLFGHDWFLQRGIPLVDHTSYYWHPATRRRVTRPLEGTCIRIEWGRRKLDIPDAKARLMSTLHKGQRVILRHPGCDDFVRRASVAGEIQRVAALLAEDYDWTEPEATEFLLTGMPPFIHPLTCNWFIPVKWPHRRKTATLVFEPWVSDDSILERVHWARRQLQVKQTRMMDERQLRLFDFVEEYCHAPRQRTRADHAGVNAEPSWGELKCRWNRKHPRWAYEDARNMKLAYDRISRRLLGSVGEDLHWKLRAAIIHKTDEGPSSTD